MTQKGVSSEQHQRPGEQGGRPQGQRFTIHPPHPGGERREGLG